MTTPFYEFDMCMEGNKVEVGVAGAGGILLNPEGYVEQTFAWGIGRRTNNEAEWLALIQGLHLLNNKKLRKVLIFGDSRHVIYKLVNGYPTGAINCRRLYVKAKLLMINSYETYHILRQNNTATNNMANVGSSLPQGHYSQDGAQPILKTIP